MEVVRKGREEKCWRGVSVGRGRDMIGSHKRESVEKRMRRKGKREELKYKRKGIKWKGEGEGSNERRMKEEENEKGNSGKGYDREKKG